MTPTSVMARVKPDVQYSVTGETAVVLDLEVGEYVVLNRVATRVWNAMLENRGVDAVVQELLADYEVDEAHLRTDILGFVDACRTRGWVELPPS